MANGKRRGGRNRGRRSRRNGGSNNLAPVAVYPVAIDHSFPEAGANWNINPPKGLSGESEYKMASVLCQYVSTVPSTLVIKLYSADTIQVETIPLLTSVTVRSITLRMPRGVDRAATRAEFTATGPVVITGRIMYTTRGTIPEGNVVATSD